MTGPSWGYTVDGRARIFDDGVLPAGWSSTPTMDLDAAEWTRRAQLETAPAPAPEPELMPEAGPLMTQAKRGPGRPRKVVE